MEISEKNGVLTITAAAYSLVFPVDRPFVYLQLPGGKRLAELFLFSSVHPLHGRDDTSQLIGRVVRQAPGEIIVSYEVASSAWQGKTYRFRCQPRRLVYEVEVTGRGQLCEVEYFGGYYSGQVRWGSGRFFSGQHFLKGFSPEPNTDELCAFEPTESSTIDLLGVPLPGRSDWFFTPPPFCFAFQIPGSWLGMGVEAQPGENHYTAYSYRGGRGSFSLNLAYEGYRTVRGSYRLPSIGFDFADSEYGTLEAHVFSLRKSKLVDIPEPQSRPSWWEQPIFCGWGQQCYEASLVKGKAPLFSRQELYERSLRILEEHGVEPGIVVLDDKWQSTYGDNSVDTARWPDITGFIRGQHQRDRRVLLWFKAWDPEGLPIEECITNAAGIPLAPDPTNPAFERRLRQSIRHMLSPEGYDADGFKIDFTARIPSGPGMNLYGEAWGLELMRRYLEIIYTAAKEARWDALIMTHTPHPYLAGVTDMIRLNDMNPEKAVLPAMQRRKRLAALACPTALIDTDNWQVPDKATFRRYLKLQPELGIPSLYYATHIDNTKEPLTATDYRMIRQSWEKYRLKRSSASAPARPSWFAQPLRLLAGFWRQLD